MPKEYPAEFKTKIIKRYQKGESIQSLSQELHIAQSTLYDWRREYCSIKTANRGPVKIYAQNCLQAPAE